MNGEQHKIANIYAGGVMTTVVHLVFGNPGFTTAAALGSVVGTIVTPDLDLVVPSNFFSRLPIINFLWMCLWWPYKKMVKHRSFVSHSPLVSTIIRLIYMLIWFTAFGVLFGVDFNVIGEFLADNFEATAVFFTCWVFQDVVHLWLDFVVPKKRSKRPLF